MKNSKENVQAVKANKANDIRTGGYSGGFNHGIIDYPLLYRKISIIGRGDIIRGMIFICKLADRLEIARKKHSDWHKMESLRNAWDVLIEEGNELLYGLRHESYERQTEEMLDCLTVAARMVLEDWQDDAC